MIPTFLQSLVLIASIVAVLLTKYAIFGTSDLLHADLIEMKSGIPLFLIEMKSGIPLFLRVSANALVVFDFPGFGSVC